ncbi:hypothetical protein [Arthrobacter sp. CAN_C5]|uniref:hypothetical protein n=1 Tax=Arthrobacter sp. CAN_C5 TaxID=2760706 RepID=UPI001AE6EBFB|nr:hypothetical protein [Arthrobacter sp. CAN_C5]MBP2216910.1 glycosyltransferase involved in cell wall biosynthesis [Arthrobacter sp. CAN_C5]
MTLENDAFLALVHELRISSSSSPNALGVLDDMPAVYRIADNVALASAFGEALSRCWLEDAASCVTSVTTSVGDAALTVQDIGYVTTHDPADTVAAWDDVHTRRTELGSHALNIRTRFGGDCMLAECAAVVHCLLGSKRAVARHFSHRMVDSARIPWRLLSPPCSPHRY